MPRKAYKAVAAKHIDPEKLGARKVKKLRRNGKPKLRVVAGTAAARALGIGR